MYPPWISWYLLVLILLLIPFDLLISLPGMISKGLLMSVPKQLEKDTDAVMTLLATHKKSYPVRCLLVKMHVTGDDFSAMCRLICPAEKDGRREVTIDTSKSGLTVFEIRRFWVISLLGLFSLPVNVKYKSSVLVLPQPIKPANTVALQHGIILRPKPGGGYSEEHDMRPYRSGDPVRSIHWKVSAKFDSLIIREPLIPPPHSRLIHVSKWEDGFQRDLILGRLRWISDYMLKWQMPFYIKYSDGTAIAEIKEESELIDYLRCVLDKEADTVVNAASIPSRFSWVFRIDSGVDTRAENREQEVMKT